jgi:hypothetical protein
MAQQTIEMDRYVPARTPVQGSVVLSTTAANLGTTITELSDTGWELFCSADWLIGTSDGPVRPVAADEIFLVPSSSLSGWYAESVAATPTVYAVGARKA